MQKQDCKGYFDCEEEQGLSNEDIGGCVKNTPDDCTLHPNKTVIRRDDLDKCSLDEARFLARAAKAM